MILLAVTLLTATGGYAESRDTYSGAYPFTFRQLIRV